MSPRLVGTPGKWRRLLKAAAGKSSHSRAYASLPANVTQGELDGARKYCSDLLRKYDTPSYILQTFVPPSARDASLAIRAFNVDVARVADTTSHPTVGAMRMQFWRDAISSSLSGTPKKEPVAILLAAANNDLLVRSNGKSRLSKTWLHRIVNTREQYLGNPPFPNLAALETYAENTYSTLLYLAMSALPLASLTADHLASHIGKAMGIAAVLRGLPLIAFPPPPPTHHTSTAKGGPLSSRPQGAVLLPLDIMAQCGVQEEQVLREGAAAAGLRDAVFAVATRANDHLITAREMVKNLRAGRHVGHEFEHLDEREREREQEHAQTQQPVPAIERQLAEVRRGVGTLMPAVATGLWLDQLQRKDFDVFDQSLRRTDWKLPWKAYWAFSRMSLV